MAYLTGSDTPKDCPSGTFTNATAQASCQDCPPGYYCVPENVTAGDPKSGYQACPRGYYCPVRTGLDWKPCPHGTFSNRTTLSLVTQCEDCPGGKYCGELHAVEPSGDCYGGYYCESGVDKPDPINSVNGTSLLGNCSILGLHTGKYTFFITCTQSWLRWPNIVFAHALADLWFSTCARIAKNKHGVDGAIILFAQYQSYRCHFSS